MENDILITEENMMEFKDQDLAGMEATLKALDLEFEGDQGEFQKPIPYKNCRCGILLQENPKGEYRCSQCGCIIYEKRRYENCR